MVTTSKTGMKRKPMSIIEKLDITENILRIKIAEELAFLCQL
jgi:hypothetical protein